jgi:hypothetical protein
LPAEDLAAAPPAFVLPAIPIAPPKAISAPASRALASGDALLDFVRDPLAHGRTKPAERDPVPDDLDPALFAQFTGSPRPGHANSQPTVSQSPTSQAAEKLSDGSFEAGHDFSRAENANETSRALAPEENVDSSNSSAAQGPEHLDHWGANEAVSPSIVPPNFRLQPEPETRIPNFGHLLILAVIALFGFVAAGLSVQLAFRAHLWGVKTIDQAATDVHYTLASMAVLYLVSFVVAFFLFPLLWHKSFFAGLQWNASAAVRSRNWLFAAAAFCFILALVDELILPGPTNAPIDKMFSNTAAAWLLFGFGVAVAPFFEEIVFRGFLLPALCTAVDWALHLRTKPNTSLLNTTTDKQPMLPLGPNGHPQWSIPAMIVGSLLTSLPFAAMHADQIAHSIGPLILLYCVSLVLCFARLATRSLAASTLVHASYNTLLFTLMLIGTGGFKHLDKM